MIRRTKFLWVASIFTVINIAGAGFAAAGGEAAHALGHVGLMLLGAFVVWRLVPRSQLQLQPTVSLPETDKVLDNLQLSLDAMAIEVERVGEAQRFMAKLVAERSETSPPKPRV